MISLALGGVTVAGMATTVGSDKIGVIKTPNGRPTSMAAASVCHGPVSDPIPRATINKKRWREIVYIFVFSRLPNGGAW